MKSKRSLSVGTKLTALSLSLLILMMAGAFAAVIILTTQSSQANADAQMEALAQSNAQAVELELKSSFDTARVLAHSMQGFENIPDKDRRNVFSSIMKSTLEENDQILGVWTCWEAGALDGLDEQFKGTEGTDDTGRFIPYWSRSDGQISLSALVDYETPGAGDYYLAAKNSGNEAMLDPYTYEIAGKQVLLTTISIPVKNSAGDVVGVTGVDLALSDLQNLKFDMGDFNTGFAFLLSNAGTVVVGPDAEAAGTNLADVGVGGAEDALTAIKSGLELRTDGEKSVLNGAEINTVYQPISMGNTNTPWSLCISVETDEIMAASRQMTQTLVIVFVCILVICALGLFVTTRVIVTKPLKSTAKLAKQLAGGDLDAKVTIKSMDEVGQMTRVLDEDVRQAFKEVVNARAKSEKQEKYQTQQVEKLLVNLERMARGELVCDMEVSAADDDTQGIYDLFSRISGNLHLSVDAIRAYIEEISQVLGAVADGDLTVGITEEFLGDFSKLKDSINTIIDAVGGVMSEINTAAEQVTAGSRQVSVGNQEISQGATEQASAIEELLASISQIADQIRQNALDANTSTELAENAKKAADEGNDKMTAMLKSMEEINESSASISKIIKVIDDIAFQTNILALNAAVEAARAGVHGKGFAVVAEEVRNLAARSAQAASETTALIEGSIKRVEAGTAIAEKTAATLADIVEGSHKSLGLLHGIATASNEQATGIAQVNRGIEQLSQVVQTNSAAAEQGAAASEELSGQAEMLKGLVDHFQLKGAAHGRLEKKAYLGKPKSTMAGSSDAGQMMLDDYDFGKY
jgi:methyl-accepting chemotaxis protein